MCKGEMVGASEFSICSLFLADDGDTTPQNTGLLNPIHTYTPRIDDSTIIWTERAYHHWTLAASILLAE